MPSESASQRQPISVLPMVGSLIGGILDNAKEHDETIQQAKEGRPHVFDEALLTAVTRLGG